MAQRSVSLTYGDTTFAFGWKEGLPAKDFGAQLADAVRGATGLKSLAGLEMHLLPAAPEGAGVRTLQQFLEGDLEGDRAAGAAGAAAAPVRVTPRDIYENRIGNGAAQVVIMKADPLQAPAKPAPPPPAAVTAPPAIRVVPNEAQPTPAAPSRGAAGGERREARFQKKGGSQFQFIRLMQMDRDPAGLRGASNRRKISMSEVQAHASPGDVWMALSGRVFNVTPYLDYHPGGKAELMRCAGGDGTALYKEIHPWVSLDLIDKLQVGLLDLSAAPAPEAADARVALHPTAWRAFHLVHARWVTRDTLLLRFDLGQGKVSGLRPGQHVNVRLRAGPLDLQRRYTPTSDVDAQGVLELVVKMYPDGKMGQALSQLRPRDEGFAGDTLEMQGAFGDLSYMGGGTFSIGASTSSCYRELSVPHVVMLAAGSGITPMIQLLRAAMQEWRAGGELRVTLVACNRAEDDVIFREDLERLAAEFPRWLRLRLLLSQPSAAAVWTASPCSGGAPAADVRHLVGRIDDQVVSEALALDRLAEGEAPQRVSPWAPPSPVPLLVLACGPEGFCASASEILRRFRVPEQQVHVF